MKVNQKGFSVVEILVVIVVVGLLGAVGWLVHDRQKSKTDNRQASTTVTTPAKTPHAETPNQPQSNQSQVSYLAVKEWGVKIPQTSTGNVISYQISADDKNMANFVSSGQKALGGSCGTFGSARYHVFQAENGYKSSDEVFQNKLNNAAENDLVIKANNKSYYILGDMSGGDCTGTLKEGQSVSQQEVTANNNLLTALKGLVSAN
jgi:prepilin-type N-terminal cleavage/methylation domain-containing protein